MAFGLRMTGSAVICSALKTRFTSDVVRSMALRMRLPETVMRSSCWASSKRTWDPEPMLTSTSLVTPLALIS
jgi:hypothetical protein